MSRLPGRKISIRAVAYSAMLSLLAMPMMAFAQYGQNSQYPSTTPPPDSGASPGWHQFSNPPQSSPYGSPQSSPYGPPQNNQYGPPQSDPSAQPVPSTLTLPAGTFLTVRVDQLLSSDKNQAGDAFSATLIRPVVADGVVVAQQGQMLGGRVAEAQKAGRVTGVSRLAVQLTDLTLVDGEQVPVDTELTRLSGPTSRARDAGAIVGSGAMGAAIGGAADFGVGAAIGAGAGAIVGTVGVLLTRGHATVIYPESELTFRLSDPITISTDRAPQAFQYVGTNQYNSQYNGAPGAQGPPPRSGWNCAGYGWPPPAPYYGGYPYPSAYAYPYPYPYYWGPSFTFWYGGYGGRYFYGRPYGRFGYRR
jgi:hypothetical protein